MTFCIGVEAKIDTDVCPLPKGRCYWQHKETKACCYTETELAVPEFCVSTGSAPVDQQTVDEFKIKLRSTL